MNDRCKQGKIEGIVCFLPLFSCCLLCCDSDIVFMTIILGREMLTKKLRLQFFFMKCFVKISSYINLRQY